MIESRSRNHRLIGSRLLEKSLALPSNTIRVGITGVPGAGKSTFIESFGLMLCEKGHRVAVLAVDPSSSRSGGSLLGDKTRMEDLSRHPQAFIRPSPAGGTLGGVAARTREAISLVEAAGYDVVLVETVGVGQSEVAVRKMVDFFLLLQIAGAGDELQGIKKGVVEIADAIAVNKADGENLMRARRTCGEYAQVLQYITPYTLGWQQVALLCSALEGRGLEEIWQLIGRFIGLLRDEGRLEGMRGRQNVDWFRSVLAESVWDKFVEQEGMRTELAKLEQAVLEKQMPVETAVTKALKWSSREK